MSMVQLTTSSHCTWSPTMSMLMILMIVLLILALGGGGWGHSRFGALGWSPAVVILVVFLALYFTGSFR